MSKLLTVIIFLIVCAIPAVVFGALVFGTAAVLGSAVEFCYTVACFAFAAVYIMTVLVFSSCALSGDISSHERRW